MLCELLLFEHIMLSMRYCLAFAKYTLSLWCILNNSDFRLRFPWYSAIKNSCLILSFAIFVCAVEFSSFFSVLSFGTTHEYIMGIAKNWKKFKNTHSLHQKVALLPSVECNGKDATCSICLQTLQTAKELPCKHLYHPQCLEVWLQNQEVCPVCRAAVVYEASKDSANAVEDNIEERNLLQPRDDTVDELSRLFELNYYVKKDSNNKWKNQIASLSLPSSICAKGKSEKKKASQKIIVLAAWNMVYQCYFRRRSHITQAYYTSIQVF
eukprot:TRINITY_DN10975_c0_g1_i1.p1 TRINITY_DN10975_c0_g1~~TRINITY_DN10975_c0_g1_i1.p1  ORF type:complete len:267 (-),score=13.59 TRINITY_DN10975_c0_g1_i1:69-869(-)